MHRLARAFFATALLALTTPACSGPINDRIYPAPKVPVSAEGLAPGTQMFTITTRDGLMLNGLAVAPRKDRPTLLVFHGNGSSAMTTIGWFAPLIAQGYGVIAADYRGYSGNPGKPSEPGLAADADAFFAYAEAQRPLRLIVVGHSLGGAVALGLSTRQTLDAIVTIGTFTQLREFVPKLFRGLVSDRYDNLAAVTALDEPYFLIHGTADEIAPWQMGSQLHDKAGAAHRAGASFVIIGATHQPAGEQIAQVMAVIAQRLDGGALDATALPPNIKLVPFGQNKPLNP